MDAPLPYPIPGPAGGIPASRYAQTNKDGESKTTPEQQQADLFSTIPWNSMQRQLNVPPCGSNHLNVSLALLRRNALAHSQVRLKTLPVLIDKLTWVGRDASVILRDPTATLQATVHATVFSEHKNAIIRVGTVLVLKDVIAFAYTNRLSGIRVNISASLHVNIRPNHIGHVYSLPKDQSSLPPILSRLSNPADIYTHFAKAPPLPRMQPPTVDNAQYSESTRPTQPPARPLHPHNRHRPQSNHQPNHQRNYQQQHSQHQHNPVLRKRPFSNPAHPYRPLHQPLHKRTAFQSSEPPTQYPNQSPSLAPATQPAAQPVSTLSALTDDHLDSILGDFDMDAVIAAHGKSQMPVSTAASDTKPIPQSQSLEPSDSTSIPVQTQGQPNAGPSLISSTTTPTITSKPTNSSSTKHPSESSCANPTIAVTSNVLSPPSPKLQAPAPVDNSNAERTSLSGVDDAMIQSLFEGLDASDF